MTIRKTATKTATTTNNERVQLRVRVRRDDLPSPVGGDPIAAATNRTLKHAYPALAKRGLKARIAENGEVGLIPRSGSRPKYLGTVTPRTINLINNVDDGIYVRPFEFEVTLYPSTSR